MIFYIVTLGTHFSFEMFHFDQCACVQTEAANQEEQCFLLVLVSFKPLFTDVVYP